MAILIPLAGRRLGARAVTAFWAAYVLNRPLGAFFRGLAGKEHSIGGGFGFGDGRVTLVAIMLIVLLVTYGALSSRDVQRELAEEESTPVPELA